MLPGFACKTQGTGCSIRIRESARSPTMSGSNRSRNLIAHLNVSSESLTAISARAFRQTGGRPKRPNGHSSELWGLEQELHSKTQDRYIAPAPACLRFPKTRNCLCKQRLLLRKSLRIDLS